MTYLAAFDFDHTIVDDNTDIRVTKLSPSGKIPDEIHRLYKQSGWTEYMRQVFIYLHNEGVKPDQILEVIRQIPFVDGMKELLATLGRSELFKVIIISDANSIFIDEILEFSKLSRCIDKIFTNPANFDDTGLLHVKEYHIQDWCKLSTRNLCKGDVLKSYVKDSKFDKVFYAGDGRHDYCPMTTLLNHDCALPREGTPIMKEIKNESAKLTANCYPWRDGHDIFKIISKFVPSIIESKTLCYL